MISEQQLSMALAEQRISNKKLGEIVVERGFAAEYDVALCLARHYGFEEVDLTVVEPKPSALTKLTMEDALLLCALPIENTRQGLVCAIFDPIDVFATDKLAALTRSKLILRVAPRDLLLSCIHSAYGRILQDSTDFPEGKFAPARFTSLTPIHKSGTVAVFQATDSVLGRMVCLSVIAENDPSQSAQFEMVRAAAASQADGVASIYDSLLHEDHRWTVFQNLQAENLGRTLSVRGTMSVPEAASLVQRIAEIADVLLKSGCSASWASPENIFTCDSGPLLVPIANPPADYAVAKTSQGAEPPMAAAVYALGRLLEQCLCGEGYSDWKDVPAPMQDILRSSLCPDQSKRYASPSEVAGALKTFHWTVVENSFAGTSTEERDALIGSMDFLTESRPARRSVWSKLFGRAA